MDRHLTPIRAGRRWLVMLLAALTLAGGFGSFAPASASAGMAGTVITDGAPLYADWNDFTVIEWMSAGVTVDHFWGPHEGLYEIRYQGIVGWTPVENVDFGDGGSAVAAVAPAAVASSGGGEHWIDINRSSGAVTLYIGDQPQATYYASLSESQGEDFYATASGTWYINSKNRELSYTPYAKAYISHWMGFDGGRDNGFHSYTKDENGNILSWGAAPTWGCVALAPGDVDAVFDFAYVGMRVEIHW
jgi:lipoprotein-anchoring transpeptidase ErfK/SrfK